MSSYNPPDEFLPIFNIENYLYKNENITLAEADELYYNRSKFLNLEQDGRIKQFRADWGLGPDINNGAICSRSSGSTTWCLERGTANTDASINFYTTGALTYRLGLNSLGAGTGVFSLFNSANIRIVFFDNIGNLNINGSLTQASDINKKKDILDNDLGLSFIEKLNTKKYKLKSDDEKSGYRYGLIYQELEELLQQDNISFNGLSNIEETKGISYTELIAPMIKAIQELTERIKTLESSFS